MRHLYENFGGGSKISSKNRCSCCGSFVLDTESTMSALLHFYEKYGKDSPTSERKSLIAHAPAHLCTKCNSKICGLCQDKTWSNFLNYPHCGSPMNVIDWNLVNIDESFFKAMMDFERRKTYHIG